MSAIQRAVGLAGWELLESRGGLAAILHRVRSVQIHARSNTRATIAYLFRAAVILFGRWQGCSFCSPRYHLLSAGTIDLLRHLSGRAPDLLFIRRRAQWSRGHTKSSPVGGREVTSSSTRRSRRHRCYVLYQVSKTDPHGVKNGKPESRRLEFIQWRRQSRRRMSVSSVAIDQTKSYYRLKNVRS